jgi:hypothetical protein
MSEGLVLRVPTCATPLGSTLIQAEILRLIANVQAELSTLIVTLAAATPSGDDGLQAPPPAPAPAPPRATPVRPAPVAAERVRKPRWSYLPGAAYRIVGTNPFRNGNNYNLFDALARQFGGQAFSKEQLVEQISALRNTGALNSAMGDDAIVVAFLQIAGGQKGQIVMAGQAEADSE